jgi:hypothetical protein
MGIRGKVFENVKWAGCTSANGWFWYERCWTLGFLMQSYLCMAVAVAKEETWKTERSSQQSNMDRCDVYCIAARLVLPVHQMPLIKGTFSPAFVAPSQYILYKVLPFDVYKNIPLIDVPKGWNRAVNSYDGVRAGQILRLNIKDKPKASGHVTWTPLRS